MSKLLWCIRKEFRSIFSYKHVHLSLSVSARTIMTSSTGLEKVFENLEKNPYYEKYAERIAAMQRTSPQELLERLKRSSQPRVPKADIRQYSSVLNPKESLLETDIAADVNLDSILKINLVKDKEPAEIQSIWEEYHKQRDVIVATIPIDTYRRMHEAMKECPTFLFPLPRSQGYEFFMCQSKGHSVHFTPLLAYQVHAENAPECLTIRHYTELEHKGIILMRGDYDQKVLSGREAACLANQFQLYYGARRDAHERALLDIFTRRPDTFQHMDLVERLETVAMPAHE